MKQYKVAILGATGAVGREMMKILAERDFPVSELHLLASPRSVGQKILWKGQELTVELAEDKAFAGMDIVLGAAENDIAKKFAPAIVNAGAVFVDNSSAFRMDPNVPLIVPEINPEDVKNHKGIISIPNCTTIVSLVAVNALNQDSPIQSMIASSYQATSGAGAGGPIELMNEVEALQEGKSSNEITEKGLTAAMTEIGEDFGSGRMFLPQVLLSAETMRAAFDKLKELIPASAEADKGTFVIATVKGDVHDLGKNITGALLANSGFKVIDLGKDVEADTIVETAIQQDADVVGLAALMTTTMPQIDKVIDKLQAAGARAKVMIGGAAVTQDYADSCGADAYAADGVKAVKLAKQIVGVE